MIRYWGKWTFLAFFCILALTGVLFWLFLFSPSYHAVIPIKTTRSLLPYVEATIDRQTLPLTIDLGSKLEITVDIPALQPLKKKPKETALWKNIKGKEYEQHTFILSSLKLEDLVFDSPVAVESTVEEQRESVLYSPECFIGKPKETVGCLGRNLLKKYNLFFDIQQAKMIATDKFENLAKDGYPIKSFTAVPFLLDPKGILVNVKTDLGKLKLLLDTGCTVTIIRDHLNRCNGTNQEKEFGMPMMTTREFTLGETDFGSQTLYFYKITEKLRDIDGLLGMDFIANHLIYIDFKKKLLYIARNDLSNPQSDALHLKDQE